MGTLAWLENQNSMIEHCNFIFLTLTKNLLRILLDADVDTRARE